MSNVRVIYTSVRDNFNAGVNAKRAGRDYKAAERRLDAKRADLKLQQVGPRGKGGTGGTLFLVLSIGRTLVSVNKQKAQLPATAGPHARLVKGMFFSTLTILLSVLPVNHAEVSRNI